MSWWWMSPVACLIGVLISIFGMPRLLRRMPKYPPGTEVRFTMGDEFVNTGRYIRRSTISHTRIVPTSPDWWSAVREEREVTIRNTDILGPVTVYTGIDDQN